MDFESLIIKHLVGTDEYESMFNTWLQAVRQDNIEVIHHNTSIKTSFLFYDKGHLLLQEAQSPVMLAYLVLEGSDVFKVNQLNQRPLEVLSQRLSALKETQNTTSFQKEIIALNQMIKMLKVIERFNLNPQELKKWQSEKTDFSATSFIYGNDIKMLDDEKTHNQLCANIVNYAFLRREEVNKSIGFVKAGEGILTSFLGENPKEFLCNQESEPQLCFHGSLAQKTSYHPLKHFGTLKSAIDRLNVMMRHVPSQSDFDEYRLEEESRTGVLPDEKLQPNVRAFYLKIKNPVRAPEMGSWDIFGLKSVVVHHQLFKEHSVKELKSIMNVDWSQRFEAYQPLLKNCRIPLYHFMFDEPLTMPIQQVKRELQLGNLFPIADDKKIDVLRKKVLSHKDSLELITDNLFSSLECKISLNRTNLIYQRVIRYFESMGYDGIAYENGWEDAGSTSYIIFRPDQMIDSRFTDKQYAYQRDESAERELDKIVASYQVPQKTMIKEEDIKSFFQSWHLGSFLEIYQKLENDKKRQLSLTLNRDKKTR